MAKILKSRALDTYMPDKQPGRELDNARSLPLDRIEVNPDQARQSFDEAALAELTDSIRIHGVLQPIGVRPLGDGQYRIIFGERRYRAAKGAGLKEIPTLVYEELTDDEARVLTALENLQREDLDMEEEARQFVALMETTGLSQRALAEHLGKHRSYIARRVRMLQERPELFAAIREGRMTQREAIGVMVEYESGASTTADNQVAHGAPLSPGVETSGDTVLVNGRPLPAAPLPSRTPRAHMAPPGVAPRWQPVYSFNTFVNQIEPAKVPPDEKPILRAELAAAIEGAQAKLRALDEGEA